jgi:hypothetical protein
MMEATNTPETSVNFFQTVRRNNPEDSHIHKKDNTGTVLKDRNWN